MRKKNKQKDEFEKIENNLLKRREVRINELIEEKDKALEEGKKNWKEVCSKDSLLRQKEDLIKRQSELLETKGFRVFFVDFTKTILSALLLLFLMSLGLLVFVGIFTMFDILSKYLLSLII